MSLNSSERQVSPSISKVRPDHTSRYYWANKFIQKGDLVLDAMCGIGYGSYIMAISGSASITSFDCDQETIDYANQWYLLPNIKYSCHSYTDMSYDPASFDKIVCFEGIEHIHEPRRLLDLFHKFLKQDGLLLLSTPNGLLLPHNQDRHPEHKFHYLPSGLEHDLKECGFNIKSWHSQPNKFSLTMNDGPHGIFMLCVASKA